MTPASKEELYLAKLCGEDWQLPYPASRLEYYYAKLCGMDVPLPAEPLSRPELYLACLCGIAVVLPQPVSRKEMYMAKACGMEIEKLPEPLSKAERYWAILVSHISELTGTSSMMIYTGCSKLLDYQIGGNDLSDAAEDITICCVGKNLFNKDTALQKKEITGTQIVTSANWWVSDFIPVLPNECYCFSGTVGSAVLEYAGIDSTPVRSNQSMKIFVTGSDTHFIRINGELSYIGAVQMEAGSTPSDYEAYRALVTSVSLNGQPLRKNEYVRFRDQKIFYADSTSAPMSLPPVTLHQGFNSIYILPLNRHFSLSVKYIQA